MNRTHSRHSASFVRAQRNNQGSASWLVGRAYPRAEAHWVFTAACGSSAASLHLMKPAPPRSHKRVITESAGLTQRLQSISACCSGLASRCALAKGFICGGASTLNSSPLGRGALRRGQRRRGNRACGQCRGCEPAPPWSTHPQPVSSSPVQSPPLRAFSYRQP